MVGELRHVHGLCVDGFGEAEVQEFNLAVRFGVERAVDFANTACTKRGDDFYGPIFVPEARGIWYLRMVPQSYIADSVAN